jgi:hypothetical protein
MMSGHLGWPQIRCSKLMLMNHLPPTRRACWWTQHPPLPAQPTHMRCRYSWVHLVLHGCLHSTDAALLDQQRAFLRYDLPSKLSDVWLCVSAAMDLDTPMVHTGKLIKVVLEAAKSCESDPRLLLSLADTAEAQDAPVNGLVASRWQLVITTRALVHKPEDSLFREAWLLWRCRDRFTRAARAADVSPFRILSESARLKVESESALLAPFLAVAARNFGTIATQVTAEMKSCTIFCVSFWQNCVSVLAPAQSRTTDLQISCTTACTRYPTPNPVLASTFSQSYLVLCTG